MVGTLAGRTALLLGGATVVIAGVTGHGFAQDSNEGARQDRVTLLQRLVVGAGAEKVAIDTPQSVSVVEQQDLDEAQATTVGEALRRIAGVNTSGSDRVLGQTFNIRGVGAPEAANEEGRIIVTVDGAVKFYEQYRMGGFFSDSELYKRVEVLRGPASSTLYGSGALGGVINFTTKGAADFIEEGNTGALRLKGAYNSNHNGWFGSFIFAQQLNESAEFLLAGNYRRADSYRTGDGMIVPSSDFSAWSGLAKGTFQIGDEGTLRLSYQQWDSDASDQDYAQVGTGPAFGKVDRHVIDRTAVISYESPVSGNDMIDLRISASFSDTVVDQKNSSEPTPSPLFNDTVYGYRTWQLNLENTSTWYGDNWENHLTYGWQTAYQIRSVDNVTPLGFHPEGRDFKTGLFVQNEFIWDDRLTLIPGMRLDWRQLTAGATFPEAANVTDVAYSPKIAAHYKLTDNIAIFGSVAHTQRFPTLDEVYSNDFAPPAPPNYSLDLKKERSTNFELGFAASAYDLVQTGDALQFKVTGFHNDIRDLIYWQRNQYPQYINLGRARIYGAELELAYDSDFVFADAAYTYTVGRDLDTGNHLSTVAPHELALTIGGKLPEHGLKFGWKARVVAAPQDPCRRAGATVVCAGDPASGSLRHARAFDVHDIFLTWKPQEGQLKGWAAQLGIDNLFNRQYKEFLHNDAAKGRTFKVTLARQFDW